jgi:hypothetical protein
MAEGVGFEPTFAKKAKAVFKTATISHSVTPPGSKFYFKVTFSGNLLILCQHRHRILTYEGGL